DGHFHSVGAGPNSASQLMAWLDGEFDQTGQPKLGPVPRRAGCNNGDVLGSVCSDITISTGENLNDIWDKLTSITGRSEGNYQPTNNNSNLWVQRRIFAFNLGVILPPTAITSKGQALAELPFVVAEVSAVLGKRFITFIIRLYRSVYELN